MHEPIVKTKKRLFLSLVIISLFVTTIVAYALWSLIYPGLHGINIYLPKIIGSIIAIIVIAIGSGILAMILAILGLPSMAIIRRWAWAAIIILYPLAVRLGRLMEFNKEEIERSFIEVSNDLMQSRMKKVPADKILLLIPHCLQQENCPHKITKNAGNCKQCGACDIGDLVRISQQNGIHLAVVTGGTLARKILRQIRPALVLAVACERDLTSGIQDTYPLPVFGILNMRPEGPCCNTRVDIKKVEDILRRAIDGQLLLSETK